MAAHLVRKISERGNDHVARPSEGERPNFGMFVGKNALELPGLAVPQADFALCVPRRDNIAVRSHRQSKDLINVSGEACDLVAVVHAPDPRFVIGARGDNPLAIRGYGEREDLFAVAVKRMQLTSMRHVPYNGRAVSGSGNKPGRIGRERQRGHGLGVASKKRYEPAAFEIIETDVTTTWRTSGVGIHPAPDGEPTAVGRKCHSGNLTIPARAYLAADRTARFRRC